MAIIADDFTDTTDVLLDNHTPTGTDAGSDWLELEQTDASASMKISAVDDIYGNPFTVSVRHLCNIEADPTTNDYDLVFTISDVDTTGDEEGGFIFYYDDTSNMYGVCISPNNNSNHYHFFKKVTGSVSTIASAASSNTNGDKVKVEVRKSGSTVSVDVYHDTGSGWGTAIISDSDTDLSGPGLWGVWLGNLRVSTADISSTPNFDDLIFTEVTSGGLSIPVAMANYRKLRTPV